MTRLLLDAHAFLWFVFDDPRLSTDAALAIEDPQAEKLLSIASLWEITIKAQIGKLSLGMPLSEFIGRCVDSTELEVVDLRPAHLLAYDAIPLHHRDPFDRLLVAQASTEGAAVVTTDTAFRQYAIEVIW